MLAEESGKRPLEVWDRMIRKSPLTSEFEPAHLDRATVDAHLAVLDDAKETFRAELLALLYTKPVAGVEEFVTANQAIITHLLDQFILYKNRRRRSPEIKLLYDRIKVDLIEALDLLKNYFPAHFKTEARVPLAMLHSFQTDSRQVVNAIKERFSTSDKDRKLVALFFNSFFNRMDSSAVTFRQLQYYKDIFLLLSKEVYELQSERYSPFSEALVTLNFNDEALLRQVYREIRNELAAQGSDEGKLQLLKEWQLHTALLTELASERFFESKAPAREIILEWLLQEMNYYQYSLPKKEEKTGSPADKIHTSLSVPLLALYIRLFKEAGIITNTNYQELFRAVSFTFTTQRKAEAAHSHLHSKFYAIEESARRKVYDQLLELAHLCKRIG